ncbi:MULTISPECIES: GFA family protein [unclassified Thalassospira]|uniref:GFA family protein n=1 Tax=unclassified Thalassospira TaxID=2648997 RepID=UPI0025E1158A|nr:MULTISPECIES: GFA family protein [unclassified Thalassospira]|tara:strand:- start:4837 stop:5283 length:447 start_codon:yes stop_codon:yes gene_type:complete
MTAPNSKSGKHQGGCHCGKVRFEIRGQLDNPVMCHCNLCRKLHGHVSAYARFNRKDLHLIEEDGLRWYRMSGKTDRGFCKLCGTGLFWRPVRSRSMAVMPGTLDDTSQLTMSGQIFCADKGNYYPLDPAIPQHDQSDNADNAAVADQS